MLPEEWLKRYGLLAALGSPEHGRRCASGAARPALLDALLAAQPDVIQDDGLRQGARGPPRVRRDPARRPAPGLRRRASRVPARGPRLARLPRALRLRRMPRRRHGPRQDDPGAGALRGAARSAPGQDQRPSLVVVPRSLVFNWKDEAARFAPRLRILEHTGPGRAKAAQAFAERRPRPHDLRHPARATCCCSRTSSSTTSCSTRRRRSRTGDGVGQGRAPAQGPAAPGPHRHADREPPGRALVSSSS